MKTKIAFIFGIVLVAAPLRNASAKVEVSTFRLRDKVLHAEFFTTDGCYGIATSIRYAQSVIQQDGPPVVTPPLTSVDITYTNGCTGEFFALTGGTGQQNVQIARDLGTASLSAIVPVSDGVVNANVTINVTWKANAPLQQAKDSTLTWDPVARTITWDRFNVRTRAADAGGNVSTVLPVQAGPTFFNLGEFPQSGSLGTDVFGTRTVTFLGHH